MKSIAIAVLGLLSLGSNALSVSAAHKEASLHQGDNTGIAIIGSNVYPPVAVVIDS
jgi:hypothetical protein